MANPLDVITVSTTPAAIPDVQTTADAVTTVYTPGVTPINVTNSAQLSAALAAATGGEIIHCAAGTYNGVTVPSGGLNCSPPVKITGPATALIGTFLWVNVNGLIIDGVTMFVTGDSRSGTGFHFRNGSNITIQNLALGCAPTPGVTATDQANWTAYGLSFENITNVEVNGVTFSYLYNAGTMSAVTNAEVKFCTMHHIGSHGFQIYQCTNGNYHDNNILDFYPLPGVHTGSFMILNAGATIPTSNHTFNNNTFNRNGGGYVQAIFISDTLPTMPSQNIVITNNTITGPAGNAIAINYTNNVTITGNTVIEDPGHGAWIRYDQGNTGTIIVANNTVTFGP